MAPDPPPRLFKRRYLGGILIAIAAVFLALISNDGAPNPSVADYYSSFESRLGYWLLLGNTRHFGLYPKGQLSPFPIGAAQRKMEDKIYDKLGLANGSRVLDAGAGSGYVAMHMAEKGLLVQAIDITPVHVEDAKRNVASRGLLDQVSVQFGDYHDLSEFPDASFDGIYTMETYVHADDPLHVLRNFYRLLRPGGVMVNHEYEFDPDSETLQVDVMEEIARISHIPNVKKQGMLEELLGEAGFKAIEVEDLTEEILPLWRLFGVLGYVPYQILRALGLQSRFTNTMGGVESYLNWSAGQYISVRAVKP